MSSETLTQSDFDARRKDDALSLTLVGMSNVGKSHWSGRLANEAGFERVAIDDLIEEELATILQDAGHDEGIAGVAEWMGQPYDPQFETNQQIYLALEAEKMRLTLGQIASHRLGVNLAVDTTGSVVHTGEKIARDLRKHSTVVYLEATDAMKQEMFERYMKKPKPVVWGDVYTQAEDETREEALARSYPELLDRRSVLYRQMAHVAIPHDVLLTIASTDEFLTHVRDKLPTAYAYSASYKPS